MHHPGRNRDHITHLRFENVKHLFNAPGTQRLLETFPAQERLTRIAGILETEVEKLQVDKRIQGRVKKQMERAQKEYYLNEKMKAIQKELGRKDERVSEVDELRRKVEQARMPKEVFRSGYPRSSWITSASS